MAPAPKKASKNAIKTIALTGGTGFIGRHIINEAKKQKIKVRALARRRLPPKEGVTWILGDLQTPAALLELIEGSDAVIHTAGLTKALNWGEFETTNVTGSANLAQAIAIYERENPLQTILLSSLSAREPHLSDYAKSKNLSEKVMQALLAEQKDTPITILRPPAVYGPMDNEIFPLIKAMSSGRLIVAGSKTNRFSMIHASDLANATLACLGQKITFGQCYELDDGSEAGYVMEDIGEIAANIFGRPIKPTVILPWMFKTFGHIINLKAKVTRRPQMLTRMKVNEVLHNNWVASENKLNDTKLWKPKIKLAKGLESTIDWYKTEGML